MEFSPVLHSFGCSNQILKFKRGDIAPAQRATHAHDFQIGLIHAGEVNTAHVPLSRCEPGFDQQDAARQKVTAHGLDGFLQPGFGFDIADRTEEADDHIELTI